MDNHRGVVDIVFQAANLVIAAGYGAIPFLVLPHIRLTRLALAFGAGFFALCGLTHVGMAVSVHHLAASWFWALEHTVQAVCTWGFLVTFHLLLRRANRLRRDRIKMAGLSPGQASAAAGGLP